MEEAQENAEARETARVQGSVHTLPHTTSSIEQFMETALKRVDVSVAGLQVLVVTAGAEVALTIARTVHQMTGATGIEVVPITSAGRASRLLRARPVHAAAGPPTELAALLGRSELKVDGLRMVVVAWADDILSDPGSVAALETLLAELPRECNRMVVTRKVTPEVESFIERYSRRALRPAPPDEGPGEALEKLVRLRYVTVAPASRPAILRRVLDQLDPPSAVVIARSRAGQAEVRQIIRTLGYGEENSALSVSSGEAPVDGHTVIFYEPPVRGADLASALPSGVVEVVALAEISEVAPLRDLAGSKLEVFNLSDALDRSRSGDEKLRAELTTLLEHRGAEREIAVIAPLLESHDAVDIAAAALHLLGRARRVVAPPPGAQASSPSSAARPREGAPKGAGAVTRLFLTIGSRDGISPGDLLGSIAGEAGISGDRIGKIELRESHSLVEVPAEDAAKIIEKLGGITIRGRKVAVREDRPKSSDRPDRGERPRGDFARPRSDFGRPPRSAPGHSDRSDRPRSPKPGGRPSWGAGGGDARPRRDDRPGRSSGPPRDRDGAKRGPPRDGGRRPPGRDRG